MLDLTLLFVRDALDRHLRNRLGTSENVVVLNHLGGQDGAPVQKNQNHLVMTLVNLEYETAKGYYNGARDAVVRRNPPQHFNLQVLLAANFDDYVEGLKILSEAILFFQATPSMSAATYPTMPPGLAVLQFEVENSSEAKAFDMWNALGARYLPSLLYKIRHVVMDAGQTAGISVPVDRADVGIQA